MSARSPRPSWPRRKHCIACAVLPALAWASASSALDAARDDVAAFVAEVSSRNDFDPTAVAELMSQAQSQPAIVASISRPAEKTLTWQEYRARFITERRVSRGAEVAAGQADVLGRAAADGVPAEYLLAITGVETFYGEITGKYRVLDALATLSFDYPPRAPFFRGQLEQYLLMSREESLDPLAPLGSYAGAMGVPQFMPGSFRSFAVDGDGDGRRDLWGDWADVFASVSNYLLKNGWRPGEPVMAPADVTGARLDGLAEDPLALSETVQSLRGRGVRFETSLPPDAPAVLIRLVVDSGIEYRVGFANYYAITRYNRSAMYASAVHDLAGSLATATQAPRDAAAPVTIATPSRRYVGSFESGPAPAPAPATELPSETPQ